MAREELRDKLLEIAKVDTLEELSGIIDEMSPEEEELFKAFLDKKQEIRDFYKENNGNLNTIENTTTLNTLKAQRQELFDKIVKNVDAIPVHESVKDWKEIRKDAENKIRNVQKEIDDLNQQRADKLNVIKNHEEQLENLRRTNEEKKNNNTITEKQYEGFKSSIDELEELYSVDYKELEKNSQELESDFDELQAAQMIALHAKTMKSQARAMAFTEAIRPKLDLIEDKAMILGQAFRDFGKAINQGWNARRLEMAFSDQQRSVTWAKNTKEAVHNIVAKAHISMYQKSSQRVDKAWDKAMKKAEKYNKKAEKEFERKNKVNKILEAQGRAPKYQNLEKDKRTASDFINDVHVGLFRKSYKDLDEINKKDLSRMLKSMERVNKDRDVRIQDKERLEERVSNAIKNDKISQKHAESFAQDLQEFNSVSKGHQKILDQVMQNIEDKIANVNLESSDIVNFVNEYAKIKGEDPNKLMDGLKENQEKILKEREGVEFER